MDALSMAQDIFSIISGVMDLIALFKDSDHYLESCYEFMNSLAESMQKYEATSSNSMNHLAYDGLKKELLGFKECLKAQKNKNVVSRLFKGKQFIENCEGFLKRMQYWVNNLNLNLVLRNGKENTINFEEIFLHLKKIEEDLHDSGSKFKDNFKNKNAANFWLKYFEKQEGVEILDFSKKFKDYVSETENKVLSESIIEQICNIIDEDGNKIINYSEWDRFYDKIWSRFDHKLEFIQMSETIQKEPKQKLFQKLQLIYKETNTEDIDYKQINFPIGHTQKEPKQQLFPLLKLIYKETNTEEDKNYMQINFPIDHTFSITQNSFEYYDLDNNLIQKKKDLEKFPLVFGKFSSNSLKENKPLTDIIFHKNNSTISRQQFQITAKNLFNDKGYYITNLSTSNPTSFRLRTKPFALNVGMLIDLNSIMFEVTHVFPIAIPDENRQDYIYLPIEGRDCENEITNAITETHKEDKGLAETIRIIQGKKKNKNKKVLTEEDKGLAETIRKFQGKKNKNKIENPYLKIRVVNEFLDEEEDADKFMTFEEIEKKFKVSKGIEKEHEKFIIKIENNEKFKMVSIGSADDNDIVINDKKNFDEYYCQMYYDEKMKGWFIVEKHERSKQKEHSIGSWILLKNFMQLKEKNIGSIGYKLRDDMEIFFNYHVFKVKLSN